MLTDQGDGKAQDRCDAGRDCSVDRSVDNAAGNRNDPDQVGSQGSAEYAYRRGPHQVGSDLLAFRPDPVSFDDLIAHLYLQGHQRHRIRKGNTDDGGGGYGRPGHSRVFGNDFSGYIVALDLQ